MKTPIQSTPALRGLSQISAIHAVRQSGCNPIECAGAILTCGAACISGIGTAACISCLGPAYLSCKDCF